MIRNGRNYVLGPDDLMALGAYVNHTGYLLDRMDEALGFGMRWEFTPKQYRALIAASKKRQRGKRRGSQRLRR